MGTIGYDNNSDPGMGALTWDTAQNHLIMSVDGTYTPGSAEVLTEVGWYCGLTAGTIEVGVYRLDTLALIAAASVAGVTSTRVTASVSGNLLAGVAYGMAWRVVANSSMFRTTTGVTNAGSRDTGLTGANALAATFTDTGPSLGSRWAVFATTAAAPPSGSLIIRRPGLTGGMGNLSGNLG